MITKIEFEIIELIFIDGVKFGYDMSKCNASIEETIMKAKRSFRKGNNDKIIKKL